MNKDEINESKECPEKINEDKKETGCKEKVDVERNEIGCQEKMDKENEEIERRNKIDEAKEEIGEIEDTTKYGEFVTSYFAWLTLDRQKNTAKRLENITSDERKQKKN